MSRFDPRNSAQLGLLGAGTMGSNLALRIDELGYRLQVYERNPALRAAARAALPATIGCHGDIPALLDALDTPRCLLLLVTAGKPVDTLLEQLLPALERGDVIIDLGNSHYQDTGRRVAAAGERGVRYVGCGISGGAEGARNGAALMPGGNAEAWPLVGPLLTDLAADFDGEPCAHWVGPAGAGHFVKTVHNGIEYAEMQLLAEAYHLMRERLGFDCVAIGDCFAAWNEGPLQSFLLEISARILRLADAAGTPAVDLILDQAGQKGTGSWTSEAALRYGAPANLLAEAVFARIVSAFKDRREKLAGRYRVPAPAASVSIDDLEAALYAARTIAYAQGFDLMHAASGEYDWGLDYAAIAAGWRAGCILRSRALADLRLAFAGGFGDGLLADPKIGSELAARSDALRRVAGFGIAAGIPVAGFAAAVAWYDGMHSRVLPANLIQAQRDYFGAHGFRAAAAPEQPLKHIDWLAERAELR